MLYISLFKTQRDSLCPCWVNRFHNDWLRELLISKSYSFFFSCYHFLFDSTDPIRLYLLLHLEFVPSAFCQWEIISIWQVQLVTQFVLERNSWFTTDDLVWDIELQIIKIFEHLIDVLVLTLVDVVTLIWVKVWKWRQTQHSDYEVSLLLQEFTE